MRLGLISEQSIAQLLSGLWLASSLSHSHESDSHKPKVPRLVELNKLVGPYGRPLVTKVNVRSKYST